MIRRCEAEANEVLRATSRCCFFFLGLKIMNASRGLFYRDGIARRVELLRSYY